jgi:3-oxoacyl-[acyl-carrier protein] reductase
MELAGKAALVTGGSGDLGGAIARALAAAGADVAVSYTSRPDSAEATATAVRAAGRRSLIVPLDQRDPIAIDESVAQVAGEFGRVDILINNAAWNIGIPFKALDNLTADIWDRVLDTNIASVGGLYPGSSSIAYSASKAALIHLSRCLAVALAPDVTVNCIAPGLVEGTHMAKRLPEEVSQWARNQAVLGRTASAQDIAEQVVTFCRAESVTGQLLVVDGGMPAGMH